MLSVIENELLGWVANEVEQIASGLDDGSMSPGAACQFLRNVARKIAAESESACERLTAPTESNRQSAPFPAPNRSQRFEPVETHDNSQQPVVRLTPGAIKTREELRSSQRRTPRRCWQMRILDLETGKVQAGKRRLTKLEAASRV